MSDVPDNDLIEQARAGEQHAFAELYDRHALVVTRYAWSFAQNGSDAQELLQETFLTAWSKLGTIRVVEASALPWLLTTCRNHGLNYLRRRARTRSVPLPDELPDVDRTADAERAEAVRDAIARLPELDRRVCELCLVEGLSYTAAATELGVTRDVVGKRLQRARTALRAALVRNEN